MCSRRPALDDILKGTKNKKESDSLSAACYDMESMDTDTMDIKCIGSEKWQIT